MGAFLFMALAIGGKEIMLKENKHYGLILNEGETQKLKELCVRYNIPITYPILFDEDEPFHPMWSIGVSGIGLIGTAVMRGYSLKGTRVFHGVKELEEFLEHIK